MTPVLELLVHAEIEDVELAEVLRVKGAVATAVLVEDLRTQRLPRKEQKEC